MHVQESNIFTILNGEKQFIIPVYQRYYAWEKEQCKRLWDDIASMQIEDKNAHFIGSIVNISEEATATGVNKFVIIDGQQRITTLTILLIALRDYVKENNLTSLNYSRIDDTLLKNRHLKGEENYKLLLTEVDRQSLINLLDGKALTKEENPKNKVLNNYTYFKEEIAKKELSPEEIYNSIAKLQIVNITLERSKDNPQVIFESLNSTGRELSSTDLIRNYILMNLPHDDQTSIYQDYWLPMEELFDSDKQDDLINNFFRDYLTMKLNRTPSIKRVYEEFKQYHYNIDLSPQEFCEDLFTYATYYTDIVLGKSTNPRLHSLYSQIVELEKKVSYPFLIRIRDDYEKEIITEDMLCEILNLCISYILRRTICNIPTSALNKIFAILYNKIDPNHYVNSFKKAVTSLDRTGRFPGDEEFFNAFIAKDIYALKNKKYIFNALENFDNKELVNTENCTIEHIIPQKNPLNSDWQKMLGDDWEFIQEKYLHTIGNLTLTAYNSELSDRSFEEKMNVRGGFKDSRLRINADIINKTQWTEREIVERAHNLAEMAKKIWPYPTLQVPFIPEKKKTAYDLESYNLSYLTRTLIHELENRILSLSPEITRTYNKHYISYKYNARALVSIRALKERVNISVAIKYYEVNDPENRCRDKENLGHLGIGDTDIYINSLNDIDYAMYIIEQAFNKK